MKNIPYFRVENIQPVLNVGNIAASVDFYVGLLGFSVAPWGNDDFSCVSRDDSTIYLCRDGQGSAGTWVWIGFDGDISALCEFLAANGVTIRLKPTNFSWAMEMRVEDPDGHVLRFGKEPDERLPFADAG